MMEDKLQRLLTQFHFGLVRDTLKGVLEGKGYSLRKSTFRTHAEAVVSRWRDEKQHEGTCGAASVRPYRRPGPSFDPPFVGKTHTSHLRQLYAGV